MVQNEGLHPLNFLGGLNNLIDLHFKIEIVCNKLLRTEAMLRITFQCGEMILDCESSAGFHW